MNIFKFIEKEVQVHIEAKSDNDQKEYIVIFAEHIETHTKKTRTIIHSVFHHLRRLLLFYRVSTKAVFCLHNIRWQTVTVLKNKDWEIQTGENSWVQFSSGASSYAKFHWQLAPQLNCTQLFTPVWRNRGGKVGGYSFSYFDGSPFCCMFFLL